METTLNGAFQELFSKVIGCAKKTLISYEKGVSIPNDSYLILIKILIANPEIIANLVEANKIQFTDKEYNKINNKISEFLANNEKQLLLNKEYNPYSLLKSKISDLPSRLTRRCEVKGL